MLAVTNSEPVLEAMFGLDPSLLEAWVEVLTTEKMLTLELLSRAGNDE